MTDWDGSDSRLLCIILGVAAFAVLMKRLRSDKLNLSHIPSLTTDLPFLSYFGVLQYGIGARDMLQRGYDKYKGGAFRVRQLSGWHVFVTGHPLVEELRKANDNELNFMAAMSDILNIDYTFGHESHANPYHIPVIRTSLTRNLGILYPDVRDELVKASHDLIPPSEEWIKVRAFPTIMKIVCRTSNRIFVGLPLCRDPDYMALNMEFTTEVVKAGYVVSVFPKFLRRLAANLLTSTEQMKARAERLLRPVIQERLRMIEEHDGNWPDKPNDILTWLMDVAPGDGRDTRSLAERVLVVNFAAIHTSTMTFSHVLYHLAAFPEYQIGLREEVDKVVREFGWTKEALGKMIKVDSFIKESSRFHGIGSVSLTRKAMKDYTFSDGTFIPKGTLVSATARAAHFDEENYEHPELFDPWRFANMEKVDGGDALRNQFVNTHPEFLSFGLGRHACPGRFFASTELKSLLATFVSTYDMKMEKEGVVPDSMWVTTSHVPSRTAEVMFRKRQL